MDLRHPFWGKVKNYAAFFISSWPLLGIFFRKLVNSFSSLSSVKLLLKGHWSVLQSSNSFLLGLGVIPLKCNHQKRHCCLQAPVGEGGSASVDTLFQIVKLLPVMKTWQLEPSFREGQWANRWFVTSPKCLTILLLLLLFLPTLLSPKKEKEPESSCLILLCWKGFE